MSGPETSAHAPIDLLQEARERKARATPIWRYFDERVRRPDQARAMLSRPLVGEEASRALCHALATHAPSPRTAVYLHIPFCSSTCDFCGYCRKPIDDAPLVSRYLEALSAQIERAAASRWGCSATVSAIYVGGGTPTEVPTDALAELIRVACKAFRCADRCEVTVESRPADIDGVLVDQLMRAGVNRVSIGVQTFDTALRQGLGRSLGGPEVRDALRRLAACGLCSTVADLIYNLPGQTVGSLQSDLESLSGGLATGVSIYPLVLMPQTRLRDAVVARGAATIGSIEREFAFHEVIEEAVSAHRGWSFLTPVQLALRDGERADYVRARGRNWDVLGLGAGSAGVIGALSYRLDPDLACYVAAGIKGDTRAVFAAQASPKGARFAQILSLAETSDGVSAIDWMQSPVAPVLEGMQELGVICRKGDLIELTAAGRFWAGNLSALLCSALREP
jgi:oxygen-independent coproporphyrinogen-3 oxidase